jgi:hypothetical protein
MNLRTLPSRFDEDVAQWKDAGYGVKTQPFERVCRTDRRRKIMVGGVFLLGMVRSPYLAKRARFEMMIV